MDDSSRFIIDLFDPPRMKGFERLEISMPFIRIEEYGHVRINISENVSIFLSLFAYLSRYSLLTRKFFV